MIDKAQLTDKQKALDMALGQIKKQFGEGAVMRLGEKAPKLATEVIPTRCPTLDFALGIGGFPRGRVVEIFGPESSGKTTLCLEVVANAQAMGGVAAIIDVEHALDPVYAQQLGVNVDDLLLAQPSCAEEALDIAEALTRSGAVDVIVIDSVAALVPKAELEGDMGDAHVGLQARLMSQALRKLTGTVSKTRTCMIFTNQLRDKVGVMYGSSETTPGGRALKYYASIRLDIRRIETIRSGTDVVGNKVRVKVVKNKLAPPFREAEFHIRYGMGIDDIGALVDLAVAQGIIDKAAAWYSYGNQRLGQGRDNTRNFLMENKELYDEISRKTYSAIGLQLPYEDGRMAI